MSSILEGEKFNYKIDNYGIRLSSKASITLLIPLRHIESVITKAYHSSMTELTQSGKKVQPMDSKMITAIKTRIDTLMTRRFYKSLCAGLYKEQIFLRFAFDAVETVKKLIKSTMDKNFNFTSSYDPNDTTPSLNFKLIEELLRKNHVNEINPHLLLDTFEIHDGEMNTFMSQFVRDENDKAPIHSPIYADLHINENEYADKESAIAASLVFVTKLDYCILALMLLTKNSIKESTRSRYCATILNALPTVKTLSRISFVTNSKDLLLSEAGVQIQLMNTLASDIIKLKHYVERV